MYFKCFHCYMYSSSVDSWPAAVSIIDALNMHERVFIVIFFFKTLNVGLPGIIWRNIAAELCTLHFSFSLLPRQASLFFVPGQPPPTITISFQVTKPSYACRSVLVFRYFFFGKRSAHSVVKALPRFSATVSNSSRFRSRCAFGTLALFQSSNTLKLVNLGD